MKFFINNLQAAAYYYHGLILDEGNTEKSHGMAVSALQAADEYLKESKRACEAFNAAVPISRYNFFLNFENIKRKPYLELHTNVDFYSTVKTLFSVRVVSELG